MNRFQTKCQLAQKIEKRCRSSNGTSISPWNLLHPYTEANTHPDDLVSITAVSRNNALAAFSWQRPTIIRFPSLKSKDSEKDHEPLSRLHEPHGPHRKAPPH
jgi:hypothetical protein